VLYAGLDGTKGRIAVGYDADFVIWSPEEQWTVTTDNIQHKNKITPYLGMQLTGVVHKVFFTDWALCFLFLTFLQEAGSNYVYATVPDSSINSQESWFIFNLRK
jgi:hypothetical protein